jgi:hypothetical protein
MLIATPAAALARFDLGAIIPLPAFAAVILSREHG